MECRDIHKKLSEYVDDVLSPQETMVIDEHLKACRECRVALADLKKTIEHVKGLETVEPPAWLTQKIMAKVRAEARPKKSLFQKLFYPLHIKMPVAAIATIAIALTTLYVFRTIEPEVKLAKAPIEVATPQTSQKEQHLPEREAGADKIAPVSPPFTQPVLPLVKGRSEEGLSLKEGKGEVAGRAESAPGKLAEKQTSSREPESMRERFEATSRAPKPMKQADSTQEAKVPAPVRSLEQAPAIGAVAKDEARQETGAAAPGARLSFMEKKKEEMLTLSVLVKDPMAAVGEIEKILKELEGKVIRVETAEGKKIITGEIKFAKLKELVVRMKAVGQVKEGKIDFESLKGEVKVKIEIVKIFEGR